MSRCDRDGLRWTAYDFPGQSEYHATNALFLSGYCVVLLCVDLKNTPKEVERFAQVCHWLSALNTAARVHALAPIHVLLIGTHCDDTKVDGVRRDEYARPWISASDVLKLRAFQRPNDPNDLKADESANGCLVVHTERWYRLNALNVTSSYVKALREHCQSLGRELTALSRMPHSLNSVQQWIESPLGTEWDNGAPRPSLLLTDADFTRELLLVSSRVPPWRRGVCLVCVISWEW